MRQIKCPNCGGNFVPQQEGYYMCDHCGVISEGAGGDLDEEDIIDLDNANYRRDQYDFGEALALCQKVLRRNPLNAEANRCALLARYKIVYIKNAKGEYAATFLDPEIDEAISLNPYYRNLPERLKREMDKVEDLRQRVLRNSKNIPQYDIFISYKSGTEAAEWAKECFQMLTKQREEKRYNVFYDEVSLGAKQAGWEPHIYSALKSAKCLILFASSLNEINSDWVKNEWKRFAYFQKRDTKKEIIVVGKNINPYELPDLSMREEQMLTVGVDPWQNYVKKRVHEICDDANIGELLKNADSYILTGKFKRAKKIFNRILILDPNNAAAYWGLLRCRLKAFDDYDLVKRRKRLDKIDEFYKACALAEAGNNMELMSRIRQIQNAQIARNISDYKRTNYENYKRKTKGLRIFKKVLVAVGIMAVLALGVFGYWDCAHPLKYSLENNQATLQGKGLFFNLVAPENLAVEKYNEYPIVAIGDGALRNSKIKTVKLAESVKTIGDSAFANNKNLTSVNCLSSTIAVGANAFSDCTNLLSISFGATASEATVGLATTTYVPSGSISLGESAFENCVSLESIALNGLTYLGANAFRGCIALKEVYINSGANLEIGMGAFDNVPDTLVVRIPTVEEDLLNSLMREYENVTFELYTRDRVEEVCYFIDKIDEISIDSLSAIEHVEQLYNQLSPEERGRVTNYGDLRDARAIYAVVVAISHIGTVTLQNEADIKAAENVFNALNEMQKQRVSNREVLVDARAVYDTMKCISEIGSVSLQSKNSIEHAEAAYGALNERQKGMVSNYSVLRDARDTYDVTFAIDLINRIGIVTEDSRSLIEQAEQAYNALSPALRTRVTNYLLLQEARSVYDVIAAIARLNLIDVDSIADISYAENLYYALTEEQQGKVTNRVVLENAREIYSVVEMIAAIGKISLENESVIIQAEKAFGALSAAEQERVGNQSELMDARAAYEVMELIAAIGHASADNRSKIEEAKRAYDSLTASQRKKVSNYDVLQTAVDELKIFDAEKLIGEIGQVTLSSLDKIETAEAAYQSLTSAQRERVSNYSVLLDARHIYDLLVVIGDLGSVTVGKGTQYSYDILTSSSAPKLNQSTFRESIDSLTFTGIKNIRESVWTAAFSKLDLVRYDLTSTSAPASFIVPSGNLTYVLVGATSKKYNMKITAQAGFAVHVGFNNFTLEYGTLPIDLTNASESYISFYGNCSVTATASGAGAIKGEALNFTLQKQANISIAAGNGTSSDGGVAITATSLTVQSNGVASLTVHGGNGKDGRAGSNGNPGNNGENGLNQVRGKNGGTGGNGKDGENGTNGGYSVDAHKITISGTPSIEFIGGSGGSGGAGGAGGVGGNGGIGYAGVIGSAGAGNGGKGGSGGKGGAGGNGRPAISCEEILIEGGTVVLKNGAGGTGGKGGAGGTGGAGGDSTQWGAYCGWSGGGGSGGNGGNGGDGGTRGILNRSLIDIKTSSSAKLSVIDLANGTGGLGGQRGEVGNTGKAALDRPSFDSGSPGYPGADGKDGGNG